MNARAFIANRSFGRHSSPDHKVEQFIPTVGVRIDMFALFDAVAAQRGAMLTLFEDRTPGALMCLREWATTRGIEIAERPVDGYPEIIVTAINTPGGASVTVHCEVAL